MKVNRSLVAVAALALAVGFVTVADAALEVEFSSGASTVTIGDNGLGGPGDLDFDLGEITASTPGFLNGWLASITAASTDIDSFAAALEFTVISAVNVLGSADDLVISISEDSYSGFPLDAPFNDFTSYNSINGDGTLTSIDWFVGDGLHDTSNGSINGFGTAGSALAPPVVNVANPAEFDGDFSLTAVITISGGGPPANVSAASGNLVSAVPEPISMLSFGALSGLGLVLARRRRRNKK